MIHNIVHRALSAGAVAHLQVLLEAQLELLLLPQLLLQRSPFTRVAINQALMWAKQGKDSVKKTLEQMVYFNFSLT